MPGPSNNHQDLLQMIDNLAQITLLGSTDRMTTWAAAIPTDDGPSSYDGFDLMTITDDGISMSYEFTHTSVLFEISTNGSSTTVSGNVETTSECDYSHNYLDLAQADRWPPISEVVSGKTLKYHIPFTKGQEHQASCKGVTNWSAESFRSGTMTRVKYVGTEDGYRDVTITPWSRTNVVETHWGIAPTFGEARVQGMESSTTGTAAEESGSTQSTSASAGGAMEGTSSIASSTIMKESGLRQSKSTQAAGSAEITVWKEVVVVVAAVAALVISSCPAFIFHYHNDKGSSLSRYSQECMIFLQERFRTNFVTPPVLCALGPHGNKLVRLILMSL